MAVPTHLTIKTDGLPFDSMLSDWRWVVPPEFTPVLMTAFGDLFLRDHSGRIHFLDLMSGEFKQVAESQEEFDGLCEDREQRRSWFIGFLLTEVRKLRGELASGQCYSCKIPLSLGGQLEADNFERTDLQVHYSILGQLHQQTTHLPPGTKIGSLKIEAPHEDPRPKRWWQKLIPLALACLILTLATSTHGQSLVLKTEAFNTDPGWEGRNNRATDPSPRQIVQNFGFSSTTNAGGPAGEIGGFITPAGEPAFYGKAIAPASFNDPLSASGILNVPQGGGHTLIGFFNTNTVNEWRTPNTIAIRIYGRGTYFVAYLEYGTGLWRVGGTSFGGEAQIPTGAADYPFSLNYDPNGAGGRGTVNATIGSYSNVMTLDSGHKADGAMFNRFGILNVMKSADDPGTIWLDNVTINGEANPFNSDPGWDQRNNRTNYISTNVRPRFDFGYSPGSTFAGGQSGGEIGGHTFRGDSRAEFNGTRLAYYGARLTDTLSLNHQLHAEGKVAFRRGVSDSTTLIGFFHSDGSMRTNDSQNSATPENFVGAAIEGPSSEGFYLYPTYGLDQEGVRASGGRGTPTPPYIYPDGQSRRWTLDYNPDGNGGTGSIIVTLGGQVVTLNLDSGHKQIGAQFNRFGIITTHIDGSGQTVYFDDLSYTIGFAPPTLIIAQTAPAQAVLQWPTNYADFRVNSSTNLRAAGFWRLVTNATTVNGAFYNVSVSTTNSAQFFRLRKL